ncbi:MAG TPA: hypothetical protein PLN69_06030 [bacterium]|nr:hypothetical protein [bacterium]
MQIKKHLLIFTIIFFYATFAFAQDDYESEESPVSMVPQAIVLKSKAILKDQLMPYLKSVKVEPENPVAGKGFALKADIGYKGQLPNEKTAVAKAYYSRNPGGKWNAENLVRLEGGQSVWGGVIPGSPAKSEVTVALFTAGEKGGALAELGCKVGRWTPGDSYYKEDCHRVSRRDFGVCLENREPRTCMFPAAMDTAPYDDHSMKIGDDYDIVDFRVGYDDRFLYVDIAVQKSISPGSITPISLNSYSVMIFNPEIREIAGEGLPYGGVMARFVPMGIEAPDFVDACSVVMNENGSDILKEDVIECEAKDPHVFFKINRNLWGEKTPDQLAVYAHTGIIRKKELDEYSFVDLTDLTRIQFGARKYRIIDDFETVNKQ